MNKTISGVHPLLGERAGVRASVDTTHSSIFILHSALCNCLGAIACLSAIVSRLRCLCYLLSGLLSAGGGVHAAVYTASWDVANGLVPDGNAVGLSDTRTLSGLGSAITDVNVTLNVSGGWNGDLYAYVSHGSGFAVLLNRVGRTGSDRWGYSDAGFNVTLDDSAVNGDIHVYGGNVGGGGLTGWWRPDGRNIDPATVTSDATSVAFLSTFNGLDADGAWTLYFADLSGGSESRVVSWGLEITTAPEPVGMALGALGVGAVVWGMWKKRRKQKSGEKAESRNWEIGKSDEP